MSILINGVSLPPDDRMDLVLCIRHDGTVLNLWGTALGKAVELQPHGRLIDADVLLKDHGLGTCCPEFTRDERPFQYEMFRPTMDFCNWVEDAETIIPPEGGADG